MQVVEEKMLTKVDFSVLIDRRSAFLGVGNARTVNVEVGFCSAVDEIDGIRVAVQLYEHRLLGDHLSDVASGKVLDNGWQSAGSRNQISPQAARCTVRKVGRGRNWSCPKGEKEELSPRCRKISRLRL